MTLLLWFLGAMVFLGVAAFCTAASPPFSAEDAFYAAHEHTKLSSLKPKNSRRVVALGNTPLERTDAGLCAV